MVTQTQLRFIGMPQTVYLRQLPHRNVWAVHAADGSEIAYWLDRRMAVEACEEYDLIPVWVH